MHVGRAHLRVRLAPRNFNGLEVDKVFRLMRPWCILFFVYAGSQAFARERVLTLEEATRLALLDNPDVRALTANVEAAKARLAGASLILQNNPTVTASAGPRSSPAGETLDYSFQVLQQFEIAGQRGVRVDGAEAALDAAEAQLQALRSEVTARVRVSLGHALAAEQRVQLADETLTIAQQGVDAADERFRAGAAALLEVNTARVEVGRAARARAQAKRDRSETLAELHLLLGLDPSVPVSPAGELKSQDPVGDPMEMVQQALTNRAELREGRRALDAARAEARLASRDRMPSPRIGASYSREEESSTSIVQGVLAFDLPLFNRNIAIRGVTAARVSQLEMALEATERRIKQEVLTSLDRVEAARAAADGYADDVVKAMRENMELATESYRVGKIDYLQLAVIRRQALEARREYIDVLEELNAAQAQLDRALGRSR